MYNDTGVNCHLRRLLVIPAMIRLHFQKKHRLQTARRQSLRARNRSCVVGLRLLLMTSLLAAHPFDSTISQEGPRPRAREAGIKVGILPVGPLNAITDVAGVMVGHTTVIRGENIRTGVTAILPHNGNLFREKVPAAIFVGNGFGKLAGSTQVTELGEIETPILLTSTLSVPRVADALLDYMLSLPGNEDVQSVNPVVAETNDGYLNDIRGRHITRDDVFNAIKTAKGGMVEEGCVGAGTGTVAFGFKGGIGTASRKLPASLGGYTLGVLVQTNFGGVLTINGTPVGRELGKYYLKEEQRLGGRLQHASSGWARTKNCYQTLPTGGDHRHRHRRARRSPQSATNRGARRDGTRRAGAAAVTAAATASVFDLVRAPINLRRINQPKLASHCRII